MCGIDFSHCTQRIAISHTVLLPTTHADDFVAYSVFGVLAFNNHTSRAAAHNLP